MKLLAMGCSATKRADEAPLPCIDRYDGPMWRTLRARLAELTAAREAVRTGDLRIIVLSAKHGFIDADMPIGNYDRLMTVQRAAELCRMPTAEPDRFADLFREAEAVMFAAGSIYRDAMWRAAGGSLADIMKVEETDGGGIGIHRKQLAGWLEQHFANAVTELAA